MASPEDPGFVEGGQAADPVVGAWSAFAKSLTAEQASGVVEQFRKQDSPGELEKPTAYKDRLEKVEADDAEQNLKLRRHLAYAAFVAVGVQLLVCNLFFFLHGHGVNWDIDPGVMIAWMAGVVVETIGIVTIITINLFPNRSV